MSSCCGFAVDFRFAVDLLWICCGFVVQLVVHQIHNKLYNWSLGIIQHTHNKSTTNPQQIHNILTCQDVVDLLWTLQQIHNKSTAKIDIVEFGFRQVVDLSWRCSQSQRAVVSRDDYVRHYTS